MGKLLSGCWKLQQSCIHSESKGVRVSGNTLSKCSDTTVAMTLAKLFGAILSHPMQVLAAKSQITYWCRWGKRGCSISIIILHTKTLDPKP